MAELISGYLGPLITRSAGASFRARETRVLKPPRGKQVWGSGCPYPSFPLRGKGDHEVVDEGRHGREIDITAKAPFRAIVKNMET